MLEGKNVGLKPAEQEDASLLAKWWGDQSYLGDFQEPICISSADLQRRFLYPDLKYFLIVNNDGAKIGHVNAWPVGKAREIGFALLPAERKKGYGTEAINLMLDYLFSSAEIIRIQARTNINNIASKKTLTKTGFVKEGTMRKSGYMKKAYYDEYLYSILGEEWSARKTKI